MLYPAYWEFHMKIEKGVPMPAAHGCPYPFEAMEVGDSFALPSKKANTLRMAVHRFKKDFPEWGFSTRVIGDEVRVWRVS